MTDTAFMSLKNHFLLAMPGLLDPNFKHAVVYICEHSAADGAMGLTINQPTSVTMSRIFDAFDLKYPAEIGQRALLSGGPVQQERGFVIHRPARSSWETTIQVAPDVCITASRDIIEDMAHSKGPESSHITLGYAGWGDGQLEREIAENSWLVIEADPEIIFDIPFEKRASATAAKLGISLDRLSTQYGHS
jgi:putative transcriptional regulator